MSKTNPFRRGRLRIATAGTIASVSLYILLVACGTSRPAVTDGSGNLGGGVLQSGACATDGATAECHVETGRAGSIVNCFSGSQTCSAGQWGPCGGPGTTSTVDMAGFTPIAGDPTDSHGGLSFRTVSQPFPTSDAGGCASNPCNPYCVGFDVDAGALQPDGGFTSIGVQGTVVLPQNFPGGTTGPKAAAMHGVASSFQCSRTGTATPGTQVGHPPATYEVCGYDFCCDSSNTCQQWVVDSANNPAAASCVKATGVDFELGIGCIDASSHTHLPACNRGTADATTGTLRVDGYSGNPNNYGSIAVCQKPGGASDTCSVDLAMRPIKAGGCIDIDVQKAFAGTVPGITCSSSGAFSGGNETTMINPPATTGYTQLAEGDVCNNYSFLPTPAQGGACKVYGQQPPPPAPFTFEYRATCAAGSQVKWNQFAYDVLDPVISEAIFTASTAPLLGDGGAGTFTTPVTIADVKTLASAAQGGDPALCPMSGPSPCPKNLATLLGAPANSNPIFDLGITLISTTGLPIVNSWQVTYSCIPAE
jgi:hypothetical protein